MLFHVFETYYLKFRQTAQVLDFIGGARRDRTADLNTASVALSQLSYGPIEEARV